MANRLRGGIPIPEYRRVSRVADKSLRGFVPALALPTENANHTISKVAGTLNRAGTNARNPQLSGLAAKLEFSIDSRDRLQGVYFYQDRRELGPNLIGQVTSLGGNIFSINYVLGAGHIVAGSPDTGAVQNFVRIVTRAGAADRMFYVKSYDHDIVNVEGQHVLDETTLLPVEIVVQMVDATRDWVDCRINYFASWSDEFQIPHQRNTTDEDFNDLKSYGGAKFVSLFQTGEDEGMGNSTEVNEVTQEVIENQHTLQVENSVGVKHVTARFRSKQNSLYYVDIEFEITVTAEPDCDCNTPLSQRCGEQLLLSGTQLPTGLQSTPSVPEVQDVAGAEGPISQDLFYLSVHGNAATASPKLVVERYAAIQSAEDLSGFIWEKLSTLEYLPLIAPADVPEADPPYLGAQQYVVCFSKVVERNLGVGLYLVYIVDGEHPSVPTPFPGPSARQIQHFPTGETGGEDECFYG